MANVIQPSNDRNLSAQEQNQILTLKNKYAEYQAAGNKAGMEQAHAEAEAIRQKYGYSGGEDGSGYIPLETPAGGTASAPALGGNTTGAQATAPTETGTASLSTQDLQLSAEQQQQILNLKQQYANSQASGDAAGMEAAHRKAEAIRAGYGYSGGLDGSGRNAGGISADLVAKWLEDYKAANTTYSHNKGYADWSNGYGVNMNLRSMANYVRQQMQANENAMTGADAATREYLHDQNLQLAQLLAKYNGGAQSTYNEALGRWETDNANLGYGYNVGQYNDPAFYQKVYGMTPEEMEKYRNDTDRYRNFVDQSIVRNWQDESSGYTGVYAPYVNGPLLRGMGSSGYYSEPEYDAQGDGFMDEYDTYEILYDKDGNIVKKTPFIKPYMQSVSDYTRQHSQWVDENGIIRANGRSMGLSEQNGGNGMYAGNVYRNPDYVYDADTGTGSFSDPYYMNLLSEYSRAVRDNGEVPAAIGTVSPAAAPVIPAVNPVTPAAAPISGEPVAEPQRVVQDRVNATPSIGYTGGGVSGGASASGSYSGGSGLPSYEGGSITDYINQVYDAQNAQEIAALAKAYEQSMAELNTAENEAAAQYAESRRQAAGASDRNIANWNELAVAQGLNSGAIGQARLAQNNQLQSDLTTLLAAEAANQAEIENQRALLAKEYEFAIAQAQAANDYERAMALWEEAVRVDGQLTSQQASTGGRNYNYSTKLLEDAKKDKTGSDDDDDDDDDGDSSVSVSSSSTPPYGSYAQMMRDVLADDSGMAYDSKVYEIEQAKKNKKITEDEARMLLGEIGSRNSGLYAVSPYEVASAKADIKAYVQLYNRDANSIYQMLTKNGYNDKTIEAAFSSMGIG